MADYKYITLNGTIVPDTEAIRDEVAQEYKSAFGADLDTSPTTPQGMLITSEALARTVVVQNNAALANQINPNISGGVFLDAIMALTGSSRTVATYTTVLANLTGVIGAIIPEGSQARCTTNSEVFQTTSTVTLTGTVSGTATVTFQAVNPGPIAAPSTTLTQIVSEVLGWETVSNPAAGTLGSLTQSDITTRTFRRNTLASQGSSLSLAISSAVYAVPGVKSLKFRENVSDITQTIDTVVMVPHSIYVDVDGGTDSAVAFAILSKKSGGCNYNGNTTVNVTDPSSGQIFPIKFSRPTLIPILVKVYVRQFTSVSDPITSVTAAVLAYANGEIDGESGFGVGNPVSSFEIAGAVSVLSPGLFVYLVQTTKASFVDYQTSEIPITVQEKATVDIGSIEVIVT